VTAIGGVSFSAPKAGGPELDALAMTDARPKGWPGSQTCWRMDRRPQPQIRWPSFGATGTPKGTPTGQTVANSSHRRPTNTQPDLAQPDSAEPDKPVISLYELDGRSPKGLVPFSESSPGIPSASGTLGFQLTRSCRHPHLYSSDRQLRDPGAGASDRVSCELTQTLGLLPTGRWGGVWVEG
jgi:hypothetical protein